MRSRKLPIAVALASAMVAACGDQPEPTLMEPPISLALVMPVEVDFVMGNANLNCTTYGYDFGVRVDHGGEFLVDNSPFVQEIVPGFDATVTTTDGTNFNWSSDLPVSGVLSKAGTTQLQYDYDPPVTSDTELTTPAGKTISHIDFCFDLEVQVTKSASATFDKTIDYDWTITKGATQADGAPLDPLPLTLAPNQTYEVKYNVALSHSSTETEHDFEVTGAITISNLWPFTATVTSVTDALNPGGNATVSGCTIPLPATLAQGESLECDYFFDYGDTRPSEPLSNTAVAEATFAVDGTETDGSNSFTLEGITFELVNTLLVDECVILSDEAAGVATDGFPATVCVGEVLSFMYSYDIVASDWTCGEEHSRTNTAAFLTTDNGQTGSASQTVSWVVTCVNGACTLTPGYWKTHSSHGPVPEKKWDDTWLALLNGPDTQFYLSGSVYYTMLWTAPRGDGYVILAHAFIAAQLNLLNGATMPADVQTAYDAALAFFEAYDYVNDGAVKGRAKGDLTAWYEILDDYNNGLVGPGHCDVDETAS